MTDSKYLKGQDLLDRSMELVPTLCDILDAGATDYERKDARTVQILAVLFTLESCRLLFKGMTREDVMEKYLRMPEVG